jgi:SP family general alpha glucoside:H+ symporter-like MFS transporter
MMAWLKKKWMWPAPLFIVAFFAPESPWWLVRKGRFDDAKRSLTRLTSAKGKEDFDADQTIAMMRHTIASEKEVSHPAWDSTVRIMMKGYCGRDVP